MIPAPFDYYTPATLAEAVALLQRHGSDAKLLAGGHSLLPAMKLRLAAPRIVVDLRKVPGLREIRIDGDVVRIGAFVTHRAIETSEELREACPLLPEVAAEIGDLQVRHRGTIGGSVVHADPAADWPAALLALEAELIVQGKTERRIPAADFFVGALSTALGEHDVLREIAVRRPAKGTGARYQKVHQSASGFAIAGVAACVTLDGSSKVAAARVGVTGVAGRPYRATSVEAALQGKQPEAAALRAASESVAEGQEVLSDVHASADYRAHLARVHARRALEAAVARAKGGSK
jgi:carbon-monoxide dehydrogenase medium subunit